MKNSMENKMLHMERERERIDSNYWLLNFDCKKENSWILWKNSIFSFFKNSKLSFLNLSSLKYLSFWFLFTLIIWSTLLSTNIVSANSDSIFTIEGLNLNQEHISSNWWWNNNWNNERWKKVNEKEDEEEVPASIKTQRQVSVNEVRKAISDREAVEWYVNNDWLKDFCVINWCYLSTKWWTLEFIAHWFSHPWLLKKNNNYLIIDVWNVVNSDDYSFETKLFWSRKKVQRLCNNSNFFQQNDVNWDWNHDITIMNKFCKKEVYISKNEFRWIRLFEYDSKLSDEEIIDWLQGDTNLSPHIMEILKQSNNDWTINYTIIWSDSQEIFKWEKLHWINLIDLNWDWLKDLITYEKYIKNWQKYKLINVYQYDSVTKTYKKNIENLDIVWIKNDDINWDWLQDFIIQRLDWKSYLYMNKWLNNNFEIENNVEWDRFDLVDINWDWNKDLISFKFLHWSQDYWTYNIYQRNWTSFDLVNDSNWFLWTNIWEVRNWSNKCLWKYFWWYTSFYVEKWWRRKYIYFNQQDWKYKWFEWIPLLKNDNNYFWCWAWVVEFSSDTDFNKVVYFKDNTWNNEFDYQNSYFHFDTWWSWIFQSSWKRPYVRKTSHNNISFSYKKKNEEVISNNYWFFILWNDDKKLYALTSYNSWVYNDRRDVWHLVRVWMWNWTDTLYSWSYIFKEAQESWHYLESWVLEIRNNDIEKISYEISTQIQDQKLRDFTKFVLWSDIYYLRAWDQSNYISPYRAWNRYKFTLTRVYKRYMWM